MNQFDSRQENKRSRESRALAFLASLLLHSVVVLAILATTWLWGKSGFERVSAYTVSLVDAPLSLTKTAGSVVPPASIVPPNNRDNVPDKVSETPPEVQKEETPEASHDASVPPPINETVKKPAVSESRPLKKEKPSKPKASATPSKLAAPTPKPKPPPPAKPDIATSKEARSAISRLRQQQTRREEQRRKEELLQQQAATQRIEGIREQLAQATNADGQTDAMAGVQRVRFAAYQERVRTQIIQAWVLPLPPEQSQVLQATVFFRVRRDGHVDGLDLVKSSGNPLFDTSLVRAINRASPLPELPRDYQLDLLEVEMRFSARDPSAG